MMNWTKQKREIAAKNILAKNYEEQTTLEFVRPIFKFILKGAERVNLNLEDWHNFNTRLS